MGWRDTVTEQAQADLDGLVDAAVAFAVERVKAAGEFLPFAFAVSTHGQLQAITPNYPRGGDLQVVDQLAAQWRAIAEVKASLRAAVVAVNVTLPEQKQDGIEVTAEHREGVAIGLIFPYRLGADGHCALESPSAHREDRRVWAA